MKWTVIDFAGIALAFALLPSTALAFDSGSTGVDGDFNPTVSTEVVLPPNGILNYRSVNIPSSVTVTFKRNATNTPVVMLVQGDVTIAGTIDISGKPGADVGPAGDGNRADDGTPGQGGPGGFDGGYGGPSDYDGGYHDAPEGALFGSRGLGPGGGQPGARGYGGGEHGISAKPGGHGSFGSQGQTGNGCITTPGDTYGNSTLLPLLGGSGGGGGGANGYGGSGGGGGGGAILLAASGVVSIPGIIRANGAAGGRIAIEPGSIVRGREGGAGSGGAIRIVASRITLSGTLVATGSVECSFIRSGDGRIRIEADVFGPWALTSPQFTANVPGPIFPVGQPGLRFSTVAGISIPVTPSGNNDVTLSTMTANPVTITLATSGIPVGSTVKVIMIPRFGLPISVDSPPTAGSLDNATTSVALDIPPGHSVLSAQTTFTVVAAVGDALSRFAQGERVEKVTLTSTLGEGEKATLHTVAGRQFEVEPALLKLATLLQ